MSPFSHPARDRALELGTIDMILSELWERLSRSTSQVEQDWFLHEIAWHESRRRELVA